MKKAIHLSCFVILLAGCNPLEKTIQKAIEQTEAAHPVPMLSVDEIVSTTMAEKSLTNPTPTPAEQTDSSIDEDQEELIDYAYELAVAMGETYGLAGDVREALGEFIVDNGDIHKSKLKELIHEVIEDANKIFDLEPPATMLELHVSAQKYAHYLVQSYQYIELWIETRDAYDIQSSGDSLDKALIYSSDVDSALEEFVDQIK